MFGVALAPPHLADAAAPVAIDPPAGVRMTAFAIASDPPGDIRVAPGGGRVLTPVIEFTPARGENIRGRQW